MNKKILIIGFGDIARRHYQNLKILLPKSKIVFFIRNKEYKNKRIDFFKDLNTAKKFKPNITLICSPANTHIKYAKIFSKINSNIFFEKPVTTNLIQLEKFLSYVKKKNITIFTGYNLRFDNSFIFFKKMLELKKIGKILSVRSEVGQYLPSWRKKKYQKTVSAHKNLGGGAINELSHDVDLLLVLFNKVKLLYSFNLKVSDLKINTEDSAHAIFKSKLDGKYFYIFLNIDFYRHDYTRSCTVIGSKATIKWNGMSNKVEIFSKNSNKPKVFQLDKNKNNSYFNEMKYFLRNIKNKNTLFNEFKKNVELIKILKSMKKKKK